MSQWSWPLAFWIQNVTSLFYPFGHRRKKWSSFTIIITWIVESGPEMCALSTQWALSITSSLSGHSSQIWRNSLMVFLEISRSQERDGQTEGHPWNIRSPGLSYRLWHKILNTTLCCRGAKIEIDSTVMVENPLIAPSETGLHLTLVHLFIHRY